MDALTKEYSYTAGGQKVTLRPDKDLVGVRLDQLNGDLMSELEGTAEGSLRKLNDNTAMLPKKDLSKELLKSLEDVHALFPVFAHGGTSIIALPEVRVEQDDDSEAGFKELSKWVGKHKETVRVVTQKPGRLVLAPTSDYGPDAVSLAQDIASEFTSFSASPRLLRVAQGPK